MANSYSLLSGIERTIDCTDGMRLLSSHNSESKARGSCVLLGYDHFGKLDSEQRTIGDFLAHNVADKDAVLLEGAQEKYQPGQFTFYGALHQTLDRFVKNGTYIEFNDNEKIIQESLKTECKWKKTAIGRFTRPQKVLKRYHDYLTAREQQASRRDDFFIESLKKKTGDFDIVFQIVGSGHLSAGKIQRAMLQNDIGYLAFVTNITYWERFAPSETNSTRQL